MRHGSACDQVDAQRIAQQRAQGRCVLFPEISGCQRLDCLSGGFQRDIQLNHRLEQGQHGEILRTETPGHNMVAQRGKCGEIEKHGIGIETGAETDPQAGSIPGQ